MISFDKFKEAVNELYTMGKLEFFEDKDKHSHHCLTLYLYCSSIDSKKIRFIEMLKPEYWNIIPYEDDLQIFINIVHVNEDTDNINQWLDDNLYLKMQKLPDK